MTNSDIKVFDYSQAARNINSVFGIGGINPFTQEVDGTFGYGGNSIDVPVNNLDENNDQKPILTNTDCLYLLNACLNCAEHQGVTLPIDIITQDGIVSSEQILQIINFALSSHTTLVKTRLNVNSDNILTTSVLTSERVEPWSVVLTHEFKISFSSSDAARFFFNTGGQFIISASREGGTIRPQNKSWSLLTQVNSPVIFDWRKYYSLSENYGDSVLLNVYSSPPLQINRWLIHARRLDSSTERGANGKSISIRSQFVSGYSNIQSDLVDGVFTSIVQEKKSTTIFNIDSPQYTIITNLNEGI